MNEVREGIRIGSLRRETEGIKKWNQVFGDPVLASIGTHTYMGHTACERALQMTVNTETFFPKGEDFA